MILRFVRIFETLDKQTDPKVQAFLTAGVQVPKKSIQPQNQVPKTNIQPQNPLS